MPVSLLPPRLCARLWQAGDLMLSVGAGREPPPVDGAVSADIGLTIANYESKAEVTVSVVAAKVRDFRTLHQSRLAFDAEQAGNRVQTYPTDRCPMTDAFSVEWRDEAGQRSVWVSGEIDIASENALRESLDCDQPTLVVDLRRVSFIDMRGLRCLVDAAGKHETVALLTSPRVDRLLVLTATSPLFQIEQAFREV